MEWFLSEYPPVQQSLVSSLVKPSRKLQSFISHKNVWFISSLLLSIQNLDLSVSVKVKGLWMAYHQVLDNSKGLDDEVWILLTAWLINTEQILNLFFSTKYTDNCTVRDSSFKTSSEEHNNAMLTVNIFFTFHILCFFFPLNFLVLWRKC